MLSNQAPGCPQTLMDGEKGGESRDSCQIAGLFTEPPVVRAAQVQVIPIRLDEVVVLRTCVKNGR